MGGTDMRVRKISCLATRRPSEQWYLVRRLRDSPAAHSPKPGSKGKLGLGVVQISLVLHKANCDTVIYNKKYRFDLHLSCLQRVPKTYRIS